MSLDYLTLHVVAMLNSTILVVIFLGIQWAYPTFAAARYWIASLTLYALCALFFIFGHIVSVPSATAFGLVLFSAGYHVALQGARAFYGKIANWRDTATVASFHLVSTFILLGSSMDLLILLCAIFSAYPVISIFHTATKRPSRPGEMVVIVGFALSLVAVALAVLVQPIGMLHSVQHEILPWSYLSTTVAAGVSYVGFLIMTFDHLRAQQQNFIALISHELRNPLAVISAATQNLLVSGGSQVETSVLRIRRTINRMSELIDNVFASDRLDTLTNPFAARSIFDLSDVLLTIKNEATRIDAKRMVVVNEGKALIRGDRELVKIAVINIVENALKYSSQESMVVVQLSTSEDEARIEVTNDGTLITPSDRKRVFEKYYRAANIHKSGSGLGLYIAREIAIKHGGDVTLKDNISTSTTFCMTLPIAKMKFRRNGINFAYLLH